MAILNELPALKVTVQVNGEDATEYEYPTLAGCQDSKRIKPDIEPMKTCLIESRVDAKFVVRVELNEGYTWHDLPHSIAFQLFIDGGRVAIRSHPTDDDDEGDIDIGASGVPCLDVEGPGFEFHDHICYKFTGERKGTGFKFSSIKSVEEADEDGRLREKALVKRVDYILLEVAALVTSDNSDAHGCVWRYESMGYYAFYPCPRDVLEDEGSVTPRSPQKKHSPEDSPEDTEEASMTVNDDEYLHEWVQILKHRLSEVEEKRAELTGGIAAIEAHRKSKRQRIALEPEQSTNGSSPEPDAKKQCRHANSDDNSDERDDFVITPASPASD
ncbi:hypothetical protein PG996_015536 [Apiospora saccharicola]|uniref:DUF7918 domain-containing protein n=1 Tax=Apiospora saccharicola TaxID=335842 RepID=A0ABR1TLL1_9PEZI